MPVCLTPGLLGASDKEMKFPNSWFWFLETLRLINSAPRTAEASGRPKDVCDHTLRG